MNILLVNDDGINSERLKFAEKVLSKFANVITIAPKEEQSGKSVSITIKGIKFDMIDDKHYAVDGTPADCVTFGLYGLKIKPDLVVSGINKGYNIGIDTIYSGTVGAALQANYHGFKAVAFSADYKGTKNMERYFERTFRYILENQLLSENYILNVNFPREKYDEDKGILKTQLYYVKMLLDGEINGNTFTHTRNIIPQHIPENTDVFALRNGITSISKITLNEKNWD
ncbi:5'/3'-nucleotidase SurE [Liberiplasma polymorphum]|uniref:5'/3'-nucleotidase SurE n=1 Tax=Liberiplasma polymorphum TaxID=3374570 RepID=UPI0037764CCF